MAYAYVYAPFAGRITGRGNYCLDAQGNCDADPCGGDHGVHPMCHQGSSSPVDISGVGQINLYVNYPTVKRIRTWVSYLCCGQTQDNYGRMVTVELYIYDNGKYCYVGEVAYGHVANVAVGNNQQYDLASGQMRLGDVPGNPQPPRTCYTGGHSHMECLLGEVTAPCCCTSVTGGTTVIYRYYYDRGFAC